MTSPGSDWISCGEIAVDGGRIVVGDSAYAHGQLERLHKNKDYKGGPGGIRKLGYGIGGSLALLVNSGFGDGGYEVFVRYTKRTKVPAELRVVFVEAGKDRCEADDCMFGHVDVRDANGVLMETKPCTVCEGTGLVNV